MTSRPRRSAAQRATEAITDMADRDNALMSSSRVRRGAADSPSGDSPHLPVTVKIPSSRLRQATGRQAASTRDQFSGRRSARAGKKRYVESSEDDDDDDEEEEEEEQDEIRVGDDDGDEDEDDDEEMDDAEGEADDMDVDAEGEEDDLDAEGDVDMDVPPAIKITKPSKTAVPRSNATPTKATGKAAPRNIIVADNDDDDDELSELESDMEEINDTVQVGGEDDAEGEDDDEVEEEEDDEEDEEEVEEEEDADAEGEEVEEEVEGEGEAEGDVEELDSDDEGSRAETPDLTKMTKRQRARFEDEPQQYMKLSDEVQAKKVFTAEELSMRRAEMARRRRNLSEKRNEEVKTETINKLLKRQAPKATKRGAAGDETPDGNGLRPNPAFVRWINNKDGSRIAVPEDMIEAPIGRMFVPGDSGPFERKMVQEVS